MVFSNTTPLSEFPWLSRDTNPSLLNLIHYTGGSPNGVPQHRQTLPNLVKGVVGKERGQGGAVHSSVSNRDPEVGAMCLPLLSPSLWSMVKALAR